MRSACHINCLLCKSDKLYPKHIFHLRLGWHCSLRNDTILCSYGTYGRHFREGWGPSLPNHWGWVIMEIPALLVVPICFLYADQFNAMNTLIVSLWVLHYVHRTLIFPFAMHTRNKRIPLSIVGMAITFNCINGIIVGSVFCADIQWTNWTYSGIFFFFLGMFINLKSDYYLISLRRGLGTGYKMTKGFLFNKISCPNHFGEIMEWLGFFLVSLHVGPFTFLVWTIANLLPRAISHHKWYRIHFADYPEERKAIIPYLI